MAVGRAGHALVLLRASGFLGAYLAALLLLRGDSFLKQAVVWLPSGVAVAGLILLGWRYWPVVALGTVLQRLFSHYPLLRTLPPRWATAPRRLASR